MIATLGILALAGCQHALTLEEAQAQCNKQGGLLVVIHTQKVSLSDGPGEQTASPGDCISPDKFNPAAKPPSP
jgi:hypothetical protein